MNDNAIKENNRTKGHIVYSKDLSNFSEFLYIQREKKSRIVSVFSKWIHMKMFWMMRNLQTCQSMWILFQHIQIEQERHWIHLNAYYFVLSTEPVKPRIVLCNWGISINLNEFKYFENPLMTIIFFLPNQVLNILEMEGRL